MYYGKELNYKFIGYEKKFNRCLGLYNTYSGNVIKKNICNNQDDKLTQYNKVMDYLDNLFTRK